MRNSTPALSVSLLLLLAACGGDDDGDGGGAASDAGIDASAVVDAAPRADAMPPVDARPADLTCAGGDPPTVADDPVSLSGTVFTLQNLSETPVQGATVAAFTRGAEDTALDSDNTDAQGVYELSAATGGVPLDAFVRAEETGYIPTRVYPPTVVATSLADVPIPLLDQNLLDTVTFFAGVDQDPDLGIVLLVVADCEGTPIEGATVSSTPAAGDIVYANEQGIPSSDQTATAAEGIAYLFNVPLGEVTVGGSKSGQDLAEHPVDVLADEISATVILP